MNMKKDVNNINLEIENIDFWSPHETNKGGMRIYWSANIGFGTLDIVKIKGSDGEEPQTEKMVLTADTECMDSQNDKAFTKNILSLLAEYLKIIN